MMLMKNKLKNYMALGGALSSIVMFFCVWQSQTYEYINKLDSDTYMTVGIWFGILMIFFWVSYAVIYFLSQGKKR